MTTTLDAPSRPPSGTSAGRKPAGSRRRDLRRHGLLMECAIQLRDKAPSGRRRAETPRLRSWGQIVAGLLSVGVGFTVLYSTGPAWNWTGSVLTVLGPAVAMLGVIDLARKGDDGERRVERIFRGIRKAGAVLTALLILMEVLTATVAAVLLGVAVVWGNWSGEVVYFLTNALSFAGMAGGIMMMVGVADLRPVALTRAGWWRELGTFRQLTNIAVPVVVVGATVALSLRDTRAVAVAMVGLATVFVGWARVDRTATDEAVRRLAEAADALAAAVRPMVAASEPGTLNRYNAAVDALSGLELACHRNLRRGIPAAPRNLVDIELIVVIRACRAALVDLPVEHLGSPLTASVWRELTAMEPDRMPRELLIFAADIRRLATLAPDRVVAA